MVLGLKINKDGTKENINYSESDIINKFNNFINDRGIGEICCFDVIEFDGLEYMLMGWELGYNNFNMFEFNRCNVFGDVIIICLYEDEIIDIDREFLDRYLSINIELDDYLIEDEDISSDNTCESVSWIEEDTHDYE